MKNIHFFLLTVASIAFLFSSCEEEAGAAEPIVENSRVSVKIDGKLWESQEIIYNGGNEFRAGNAETIGVLTLYLSEDAMQENQLESLEHQNFNGSVAAAWFSTPGMDTTFYSLEGQTIVTKNDEKTIEGTFAFESSTPEVGSGAVLIFDPPVSASFTEGSFILDLDEPIYPE